MYNSSMISQKDSSCLNASQPTPSISTDAKHKAQGLMNTGGLNSNSSSNNNFASPDGTNWTQRSFTNHQLGDSNFVVQTNNTSNVINAGAQGGAGLANANGLDNLNIPAPNSVGTTGGADDMRWLEQALKNPQLASSAKFLLETTNFINSCIRLNGNEVGHGNALSINIPPKIQASSNSNVNGLTNSNAMMNCLPMGGANCSNSAQPQNSLAIQNQLQGSWSQGNSTLNSSMNTAVLPQNIAGNKLSRPSPNQMFSVPFQPLGPDACIINQNTMLSNNMMLPSSNLPAQSINNLHQQYQVNTSSNMSTQFKNNNGQHHQQTMNSFERQQCTTQPVNLLSQQQVVNQQSRFNFVDSNRVARSRNSYTSLDDELNNLEPEDFRQEATDDFDLSFLLDESSPDDRSGNRNARNGAVYKDDGSSTIANQNLSFTTLAPKVNATLKQPEPQVSQPGSSQQMQEHLREISKQHMRKFQMAHSKQQAKNNDKKQKRSDSKGTHQDGIGGFLSLNSLSQKTMKYEGITIPRTMGAGSGNLSTTVGVDSQSEPNFNYAHSTELFAHGNRHQYLPAVGGGMKRKRETSISTSNPRMPEMKSLYEYIESMLRSRGYSLIKLPAKEIGYMTPPSPLQTASFGFAICSSIKKGGAGRLSVLLASGLSPNPVNKFGDSPFFLACKRGLPELIKTFLDHGTDVRVADGFGRTALHYVAWSNDPCFASAKLLLTADARLICVMDNHGNTPLDFVADNNKYVCILMVSDL